MEQALQYLEAADAARFVGVSPATINAAADRGRLTIAARTCRGSRLYLREDVEAFAARRQAQRVETAGATR